MMPPPTTTTRAWDGTAAGGWALTPYILPNRQLTRIP